MDGLHRVLEPHLVASFLRVRLLSSAVIAVILAVLWWTPAGRRLPGLLSTSALAVVLSAALWMAPQVDHPEMYLVGASLVLYSAAAGMATHWGWTAALGVFAVVTAPRTGGAGTPSCSRRAGRRPPSPATSR